MGRSPAMVAAALRRARTCLLAIVGLSVGCDAPNPPTVDLCSAILSPAVAVEMVTLAGASVVHDDNVEVVVRGISGSASGFVATKGDGASVPDRIVFGGHQPGRYEVAVSAEVIGFQRVDTVLVAADSCGLLETVLVRHTVPSFPGHEQ